MANVRPACGPVRLGQARCFALIRTDAFYKEAPQYVRHELASTSDLRAAGGGLSYGPIGPAQLAQAYNTDPSKGSGQTIGIVDAYHNPSAADDLKNYRSKLGLPACTTGNGCLKILNQNAKTKPVPPTPPPYLAGWAGEIDLDLDMVSAVCPKCHIVLIEANSSGFTDLFAAEAAAAKAGANVISNSYGGGECGQTSSGIQCQDPSPAASYYDIKGVVITASTGDNSWFAGPQAPADFQTVVAVGGTSLYPFNNSRKWMETGWTYAGSSCSKFINSPSWAKSAKCPDGKRPLADVSAVADPYTGVLVYQSYPFPKSQAGFYVYGGTSASSPIVAAMFGLAGNASSQNAGQKFWNAPKNSLTDVLLGENGIVGLTNDAGQPCSPVAVCVSGPGWDGPTGNGTAWGLGAF